MLAEARALLASAAQVSALALTWPRLRRRGRRTSRPQWRHPEPPMPVNTPPSHSRTSTRTETVRSFVISSLNGPNVARVHAPAEGRGWTMPSTAAVSVPSAATVTTTYGRSTGTSGSCSREWCGRERCSSDPSVSILCAERRKRQRSAATLAAVSLADPGFWPVTSRPSTTALDTNGSSAFE